MGGRGARFGTILLTLAVAVVLRVAAGWALASGPDPLPFPDDAPYHWIRLAALIEGPVDLEARDLGSGHPEGVLANWPWGFDLAMATLARIAGAAGSPEAIFRFTSLAIPFLGALLLPLVLALARRAADPPAAAIAVALVAVMPFHVQYTMMGRVDHHVLEPITLAAAVLGLLPGISWIGSGISGLVQGLSFALFPSALYPVLVVMALRGPLAAVRRPGPTALWAAATWAGAAASLAVSPYARDWAFFAPSRTHLVLTGICTAGILGIAAARRLRPSAGPGFPLGLGAAAVTVTGGLLLWAFPAWVESFRQGIAYLARGGFARLSFEARPLLADPLRAWMLLGIAAPAGLAGLWRLARSDEGPSEVREARRGIALLVLALGAGALLQRRFVMVAIPLFAIAIAEGLAWTGRLAAETLSRAGARRSLMRALLGVSLAGILFQDGRQALALAPWQPRDQAFLEAARRVATRVRESPGGTRRGVIAPWGFGHLVRWASGMPVICDNFFGAPDHDRGIRNCMEFLLETDEEKSTGMLERLGVRFAMIAPPHPEEVRTMASLAGLPEESLVDARDRFTARFARTAWVRLGRFAAAASPGSPGPLGSLLIWNVRVRDPATGEVQAEVAVLEFGNGTPGDGPPGGLYPGAPPEDNAARQTTGDGP